MRSMMRLSLLSFALFLLALLVPSTARSAVVYVNDDAAGPVRNGNSWATAYRAIPEALETAASGDEVWVAEGTYDGGIVLKEGVALLGGFAGDEAGPEQRDARDPSAHLTVLDGSSSAVVATIVTAPLGITPATVLDGFTLRTGSRGVFCDGSSPTIRRNAITGIVYNAIVCRQTGLSASAPVIEDNTIADNARGIYGDERSAPVIRRNRILRNGKDEVAFEGGGMFFASGAKPVISGNLIAENRAWLGAGLYAGSGVLTVANNVFARNQGIGLYAIKTGLQETSLIANNTFVENTGAGLRLDASPAVVANNIFAYNSTGFHALLAIEIVAPPALRNNDAFGNAQNYTGIADPTGADGNISAAPLFVDRAAGDYHLGPASPCIDAGDDGVVGPEWRDIDGQDRLMGPHVDIGADEFAQGVGYSLMDAARAMRVAAGLREATPDELGRWNVVTDDTPESLEIRDTVRLARLAAGTD